MINQTLIKIAHEQIAEQEYRERQLKDWCHKNCPDIKTCPFYENTWENFTDKYKGVLKCSLQKEGELHAKTH